MSCERIVTVNSRYASLKISAECKDVGDMNHVKLESLLIGGGASILPHISLQSPLLPGVCHNQLLENCDILCLQETFLAKQDLKGLNSISDSFHGAGESTTDLSLGIKRIRIPGGVAILWNKKLDSAINVIRLGVDWCIAIHFSR